MSASPFASILHREAIRRLTDDRSYARGQDYFARGCVAGLRRRGTSLIARVRGTSEYGVRIWVKDASLAYSCDCPVGVDGAFCKHCVAVALAWLAEDMRRAVTEAEVDVVRAYLAEQPQLALVQLVVEAAAIDPRLMARLVAMAKKG